MLLYIMRDLKALSTVAAGSAVGSASGPGVG